MYGYWIVAGVFILLFERLLAQLFKINIRKYSYRYLEEFPYFCPTNNIKTHYFHAYLSQTWKNTLKAACGF
jgi:hypothetical protein